MCLRRQSCGCVQLALQSFQCYTNVVSASVAFLLTMELAAVVLSECVKQRIRSANG